MYIPVESSHNHKRKINFQHIQQPLQLLPPLSSLLPSHMLLKPFFIHTLYILTFQQKAPKRAHSVKHNKSITSLFSLGDRTLMTTRVRTTRSLKVLLPK